MKQRKNPATNPSRRQQEQEIKQILIQPPTTLSQTGPASTVNAMTSPSSSYSTKVDASAFYSEYHGHLVPHLEKLLPKLRESSDSIIWTAGDSSLDNKYWFRDQKPAVGAYRQVLEPPISNADVTYWLNYLCANNPKRERIATINTAVEATTVNERTFKLWPQDIFLRDNIQSNDVLLVSVGANDVAMAPAPCTILAMAGVICLPNSCIQHGCVLGACPCNDCCYGCGASLLSCACSCPPCLGYFLHLFGPRVQKYIEFLTAKTKPKKILVCMIYYSDEYQSPSWANAALGILGYNSNPQKLQTLIRRGFERGTSEIKIPGTQVIPVPLFNALDGKNSEDYIARVEPSSQGGRKMAEYILDVMDRGDSMGVISVQQQQQSPTTSYMKDRD